MTSMNGLEMGWAVSLMAAFWFVPVAAIRVMAYVSGDIDHTRTMRITATVATIGALVAVNTLVVLSVLMLA